MDEEDSWKRETHYLFILLMNMASSIKKKVTSKQHLQLCDPGEQEFCKHVCMHTLQGSLSYLRWVFLMNCWIFLAAWFCRRWEMVRLDRTKNHSFTANHSLWGSERHITRLFCPYARPLDQNGSLFRMVVLTVFMASDLLGALAQYYERRTIFPRKCSIYWCNRYC